MVFEQIQDDIEKLDAARGAHAGYVAGADTLAGQVVKITGDNEVSPSDTDGEEVIGVCTQSVSEGDTVNVLSLSTMANVRSNDGVSAGDYLASAGNTGEEGEVDTAAADDFVVGMAVEDIGAGEYGQAILTLAGQVNA